MLEIKFDTSDAQMTKLNHNEIHNELNVEKPLNNKK